MNKIVYFLILSLLSACGSSDSNSTTTQKKEVIEKPTNGDTNNTIENKKDWYTPDKNTSWQWQLNGNINSSYDVDLYDIDLFDSSETLIKELHSKGKKVICYFSAGSFENWREDANKFPAETLGKDLDGWDGERWLDIRNKKLYPIMKSRLELAKQKGCDGVEPDNVDGYTNKSGFKLTTNDQLEYNIFLADEAHKRGLSIGLKNDLDQIKTLEQYFDFSVNEQCHEYNECNKLKPFIEANKPVFNAEYNKKYKNNREKLCKESLKLGFQTLILPMDLDDSFRISCE
jgi:hypothetical protein